MIYAAVSHNPRCPWCGQVGQGNIRVHRQRDQRFKCARCGTTFRVTIGSESAGPDGDDSTGGPAGSEIGRRSTAVPFLHDQLVKASAPGARRTRANPQSNRAILDSDQRHDASQHVRQERLVGVGKVVGPE